LNISTSNCAMVSLNTLTKQLVLVSFCVYFIADHVGASSSGKFLHGEERALRKNEKGKKGKIKGKKGTVCENNIPKFPEMYVFGDSLSDSGNLQTINTDFPPRFTANGKFAVEYIAESLGLELESSNHLVAYDTQNPEFITGTNYAIIGATAISKGTGTSLLDQVNAFMWAKQGVPPPDALYFVIIGGNDINMALHDQLYIEGTNKTTQELLKDVKMSADAVVENGVKPLLDAGARHILVMDAPRVDMVPYVTLNQPKERSVISEMGVNVFNNRLSELINGIECEQGISIAHYQGTLEVILQAERDGLQIKTPCTVGFSGITSSIPPILPLNGGGFPRVYDPACILPDASGFAFLDELHPTDAVHQILAEGLINQICIDLGTTPRKKYGKKKGCRGKKGRK